jgi:hypothetical protein
VSTHTTDPAGKPSSNHLNRQIGLYSLAAAVAGVSMLALAEPASGEVVVTKKTIAVPITPWPTPEPVRISIANNGIDNFSFWRYSLASDRGLLGWGANRGSSVMIGAGGYYAKALALPRGAKIGPSYPFFSNYTDLIEATESGPPRYSRGYWGANPKDRYLGIRFLIGGQTHYGWIRLTVTSNFGLNKPTLSATITGYAYETVPNKRILAGTVSKPASEAPAENAANQAGPSLGMLAAGAESMPLWRREEASVLH